MAKKKAQRKQSEESRSEGPYYQVLPGRALHFWGIGQTLIWASARQFVCADHKFLQAQIAKQLSKVNKFDSLPEGADLVTNIPRVVLAKMKGYTPTPVQRASRVEQPKPSTGTFDEPKTKEQGSAFTAPPIE